MIVSGNFGKPERHPFNDEFAAIKGHLDHDEARVWLAKWMMHNPGIAYSILTGGEKLFPFQVLMLKTYMQRDFTITIASRGISKSFSAAVFCLIAALFDQGIKIALVAPSFRQCLKSDSYIFTNQGMRQLRDLSIGNYVVAKDHIQEVTNKWINQIGASKIVKTKRSYSFEGLIGHRVLTWNPEKFDFEYKLIEELDGDDILPLNRSGKFGESDLGDQISSMNVESKNHWVMKNINKEALKSHDFYYYLGLLISDGSFEFIQNAKKPAYSCTITSADDEIIDFCKNFSTLLKGSYSKVNKRYVKQISISSKEFCTFLYELGFKSGALNKQIPQKILGCKKEYLVAMLRGMYDGDGCCYINNKRKTIEVKYATSSVELARQLQELLLNFGIVSKKCFGKADGEKEICGVKTCGRESYTVRITGKTNVIKFYNEIGFGLKRKQDKLVEGIKFFTRENDPSDMLYGFVGLLKRNNIPTKSKEYSYGRAAQMYQKYKHRISQGDREKIEYLFDRNFYFDKVASISDSECETIDIEVENEHCYTGGGFIHHNSKAIFRYIENIVEYPNAHLIKPPITRTSKNGDAWEYRIGKSIVYALPLGNSGGKVRGYRCNILMVDEFLEVPKEIMDAIVTPFLVVKRDPMKQEQLSKLEERAIAMGILKEEDRWQFPRQKLILMSSAGYKFQHIYKVYEEYIEKIMSPDYADNKLSYGLIQLPYMVAPDTLLSKDLVEEERRRVSDSVFKREYLAQFADDSSGYFSMQKMEACTLKTGDYPYLRLKGNPQKRYILGMDSNYKDNENSDHFAMCVIELSDDNSQYTIVHQFAKSGYNLLERAKYIKYLFENFNIVYWIIDDAGAEQLLQYIFDSTLFRDAGLSFGTFDSTFEKAETLEKGVRQARKTYSIESKKIIHRQYFDSRWISLANESLQTSFDRKRMRFAALPDENIYKEHVNFITKIVKDLSYAEEQIEDPFEKSVDLMDRQKDLITLVKNECALIEVKISSQGTKSFDLPQSLRRMTGIDRPRKDSYTALMLANWGWKCYLDITSEDKFQMKGAGFRPVLIKR